VRLRRGQAARPRGVVRFVDELIARVARAGASGEKLLRLVPMLAADLQPAVLRSRRIQQWRVPPGGTRS
jgi:hypothetical protein